MEKFIKAFHLTVDKAILFYEVCEALKAETEEQRVAILEAMVKLGKVKQVVETPKTKEEYIAHLQKHFKILNLGE